MLNLKLFQTMMLFIFERLLCIFSRMEIVLKSTLIFKVLKIIRTQF